jgi:hypothetical protein
MLRSMLLGLLAIGLLVAYVSLTVPEGSAGKINDDETVFPEKITQILQHSCYDCHTTASSNEKAKGKLNFDQWNELTNIKKIDLMDDICTEVQKGKMPPEKYLTYHPDNKPTAEQVQTICSWVDEESTKLMGEKEE